MGCDFMSNVKFVKKEKRSNLLNYILIGFIILISISIILMLSEKRNIKEIDYRGYAEKMKSSDYSIFLLAREGCTHCQMYKPFVDKIAKKYELTVYYLDVDKLKENEFYDIHDSVSALINEYSSDGEAIIPTPTTVIYKNGSEIVSEIGNIGEDGFEKLLINNRVVE